ncbi:MAG: DUF58 domain-containing protein [Tissierellia bacterium]|nr:DUF58 domain-containing protein [Tissierellia bacterium]
MRNLSKFTIPYIEIENNISKELTGEAIPKIVTTLNSRDYFTYNEELILKRRGYYPLGEIHVIIKDIFGFFTIKKKVTSKTSLLVYPIPTELNSFKITSIEQIGDMIIDNKAFEDKSRISSLREFREGDSVKAIHWKLSAKLDELIIKEFDNSADTNVIVFVDNYYELYKKDLNRRLEDKIVDISISVINYYLEHNIPVTFQAQDGEKTIEINGSKKSDLKPFLEALAKFESNGTFNFETFMKKRMNIIRKGSTVVIITPNLDKSTGAQGLLLKSKNLNPLFIVVTYNESSIGLIDATVEKGLSREAIPIYILDYETNIKAALEA